MTDFSQALPPAAARRAPPLERWHPPFSGDIDICIARNGQWLHEGRPILRRPLVQLFASILRREADGMYYLVTPAEKWRIRVEDLPLRAIDVERGRDGCLAFTLDDGGQLIADDAHPVRVETAATGTPAPSIPVRHGLKARILRSVFYRLADMAEVQKTPAGEMLVLTSGSSRFQLGRI